MGIYRPINACDFHLWKHLKQNTYRNKQHTLMALQIKIWNVNTLKPKLIKIIFKNSVHAARKTWTFLHHKDQLVNTV
jgi:hypothetical protein